MAWADAHRVSYLGWSWNTKDCSSFPALISSYDETPTAHGVGLRDHLTALAAGTAQVRNTFEDVTTQGWAGEYNAATTSNTSLVAYVGIRSLEISVPAGQYGGVGTRTGLTGLASGRTVTHHKYRPAALAALSVPPFVQRKGGDYAIIKANPVALTAGLNTVTWTIPTVDSILGLGLQVDNTTASALQVDLDQVRW